MKRYLAVLVVIWCITPFVLSAQEPNAILGIWHNPHGTDIQIIKRANAYFGQVVLSKDEPEQAQAHSRVGTELLKNFTFRNRGVYAGGKILDSGSGKTYNGQLKLIDNDKLNVRIFFGIIQLGRTEIWTRVSHNE
jgi:uncharacterized protein (DUF2147 family)